jgi:small subunit ribosomal protein S1
VENPREIVQPGDEVKVKILEIDSERRRLSLSIKRVEGQVLPRRTEGVSSEDLDDMPELGLSEDVFSDQPPAEVESDVEAEAPDAAAELPEQPAGEDTEQE